MPRLFQGIVDIENWRNHRDLAVDKLDYATLRTVLLTTATNISNIGGLSHKLFLVSRKKQEGSHEKSDWAVISIITRNVERKLVKKLIHLQMDQVLDLYRIASGAAFTRRMAGVFYEILCIKRMADDGVNLELLKMVRLAGTASKAGLQFDLSARNIAESA